MDENILVCSKQHNFPIQLVLMNHQLPPAQRLLCSSCIADLEGNFLTISLKQAKNIISLKQEKLQEKLNQSTNQTLEQLNRFKQKVNTLKSDLIQQFEFLLENTEEWINNLMKFAKKQSRFSLMEEIEYLDESIKYQEEKLMYEINQFNYSYYKKIEKKFQIDGLFKSIVSTKQAIDELNIQNNLYPQQFIRIKKLFQNSTPFIALDCPKHNSEIIYVDLRKNIKKEERLKCVNCTKGDSVTVMEFAQLWDKHQNYQQQQVQHASCEQKKRLQNMVGIFQTFIADFIKIIHESNLNEKNVSFNTEKLKQEQIIRIAEKLSQVENQQIMRRSDELENNITQSFKKAFEAFQVQVIEQANVEARFPQAKNLCVQESYKIIGNKIRQQDYCYAIAFNHDGSIMAAVCLKVIQIWMFVNGNITNILANLTGHTGNVYCLVYSKRRNWIASGGQDFTIRLWKEMGRNQWQNSQPRLVHKNYVHCLLMNKEEDQLISGSADKFINIWKINFENNSLDLEYSLKKHEGSVYSISLNESENNLVTCGRDKQILIWVKGESDMRIFGQNQQNY